MKDTKLTDAELDKSLIDVEGVNVLVYDTSANIWGNSCITNSFNELEAQISALRKQSIPEFYCNYCGTQCFKSQSSFCSTPHCPNCGALMIKESIEGLAYGT